MNNIPLKNLDWFSFTSDLNKLRHLSIFQAVAYIMRKEPDLVLLGNKYEELIHNLEIESADETYEYYGETTDQYSASNVVKLPDYQEICIPESEVKDDLTSLNDDRIAFTIDMGAPVSIIYYLLQSEINNNKSLEIIPKTIGGLDNFYFKRKNLKDWKSLTTIKDLGLLDANLNPKRKSSTIKEENILKVTGMLMHLLKKQPLIDEYGEVKFVDNSGKIIISKFYNFFEKEYLDKDLSIFPKDRKVFDILDDAYGAFLEDVAFKQRS